MSPDEDPGLCRMTEHWIGPTNASPSDSELRSGGAGCGLEQPLDHA